jgi:hypothetical protein
MRTIRWIGIIGIIFGILWTVPVAAQCGNAFAGGAVQDCSAIFGGDGGPIAMQIEGVNQVVLRSQGSDDSRTGFAGSGGEITAVVTRPLFDGTILVQTDGGNSSGTFTGGDGGDVFLLVISGRSVRELRIETSGGDNSGGTGASGDAGNADLTLDGVTIEQVIITSNGETGGIVTVSMLNGASVDLMTVEAGGGAVPGEVALDMEIGTTITTLQTEAVSQSLRVTGGGIVGRVQIGDTSLEGF